MNIKTYDADRKKKQPVRNRYANSKGFRPHYRSELYNYTLRETWFLGIKK